MPRVHFFFFLNSQFPKIEVKFVQSTVVSYYEGRQAVVGIFSLTFFQQFEIRFHTPGWGSGIDIEFLFVCILLIAFFFLLFVLV